MLVFENNNKTAKNDLVLSLKDVAIHLFETSEVGNWVRNREG